MIEGSCHCGAVSWRFDAVPDAATACNCTTCRRYGVLWIYGHEGEDVQISGPVKAYVRRDGGALEFLFCPDCGAMASWRALHWEDGRRRMAVNIRLAAPETVAHLPIEHFDGLATFDDIGQDGRCVKDMWF